MWLFGEIPNNRTMMFVILMDIAVDFLNDIDNPKKRKVNLKMLRVASEDTEMGAYVRKLLHLSKEDVQNLIARLEGPKKVDFDPMQSIPSSSDALISALNDLVGFAVSGGLNAAKLIAVGLATIAMLGSAIGIGIVFGNLVSAAALNPANVKEATKFAYLGFALCESIALLALMIIIYVLFVFLFCSQSCSDCV
jgi:F0F1-type ATP synthase membrane subunit c/vacuolar-type H+-ATPase subunit K